MRAGGSGGDSGRQGRAKTFIDSILRREPEGFK
jgi:hypothetical protein